MASSSSFPQSKDEYQALLGIEPPGIRRKVSESTALYDVFINHRGPDSKYSLALPLYNSLKELGIRAFLDLEEMELGQSFPSTIETAIRSAAVHIAIFSKRYAESPWCLAELLLMLHSPAKIIPVFYEVEPWALRHIEKGVYADAFIAYQNKSRYLDKLKQWKEALQSISFTTGYEMNNSNDHRSIVSAVQREVQRAKPLHVARYPVALDKLVQEFERRCLNNLVQGFEIHCGYNKEDEGKAKIVGIFGMGGVGKTTLSKELFNRKRQQYDGACFLFDVREASSRCNLPSLQMKLLKDLFGEKDLNFQSTEEGLSCISNCLKRSSSLSFLIVLDDVNHLKQLGAFSIMDILKNAGNSLVIITTRDVGLLIAEGINIGYYLKGMDKDDARQLFSWHAFSQPHPPSGYDELVDDFLGVCGGLPLSLQVLGSHVHGRDENYWRSELQKLGRTMHHDIRTSLKVSFDALATEEKQIFMDMACFFVDQLKCIAISVWKASGWSAENGLQALKDKCLVEEIEDPVPVLRMHDHLRDLGRQMANESQPHRLWRPRDLQNLESKGFKNLFAQTKGRCFHSIFDKSLNFEVKFFLGESDDSTEVPSCLLLLHLWYPYLYSELNHLRHPQHEGLRVKTGIPSWIPLQDIQCLRISNGYFKRLWQHDAEAPSELKKLEIYRTFLEEYPNFLGILTNVEKKAEKEVNEGPQMSKIKSLIVKTCRRLSGTLPTISTRDSSTFKAQLNGGWNSATVKASLSLLEDLVINEQDNIKIIILNGTCCPGLRSLELSSMKNLIELQFARVETLIRLSINKCEFLKIMTVTSDLTKLEELSISACPMLEEPNLGHLTCLRKIRIADCNMGSVPGISSFEMLVELNVSRCPKLHELSLAHLSCLEKLEVKDCDHLESVTGLSDLLKLVEVSISWCWILQLDLHLVGLNSLKRIKLDKFVKVKSFELNGCKNLETVSGISFEMVQVINICGCPELMNVPDICSPSYLELIIINGCRKLNHLRLTTCAILKRLSGNFDLNGLSISDCPMLKQLPSFEHLIYLEEIHILQCMSLKTMTLPTTLKRLELNSCRELKEILGICRFTKVAEINIKKCPQLRLELDLSSLKSVKSITIVECCNVYGITLPPTLIKLKMQRCMKLQFAEGIGHLTELRELHISECPVIEEMPLVVYGQRWLEMIAAVAHLPKLTDVCIGECEPIERLLDLAVSSCLERINIFSCDKLHSLTLPRTIVRLIVCRCRELQIITAIGSLPNLTYLCISECEEVERLPDLPGLSDLVIDSCQKLHNVALPTTVTKLTLQRCRNFKTVGAMGHFTKLRELHIIDCSVTEEMPVVCGLDCLESITIDGWSKLSHLHVNDCAILKAIMVNLDMGHLAELWISDCPELEELPGFSDLTCLVAIRIFRCGKLQKVTFPRTLKNLQLECCKELNSMSEISHLKNLVELIISGCGKLEIELRLEWMSSLQRIIFDCCGKMIVIDWCAKLQSILLPTTLIKLTVRRCRELRMVKGIGNLTKLEELSISECPELEEFSGFANLSSLIKLRVQGCKGSHMLAAIKNLTKLEELSISEPSFAKLSLLKMLAMNSRENFHNLVTLPTTLIKLKVQGCTELPMLGRLSCLKTIVIESCETLENIQSLGELQALEALQILYCTNATIRDCISNLKQVPSNFIQVVGRAAEGAISHLNAFSLTAASPHLWRSPSDVNIICGVVMVSNTRPSHTINESLEDSMWNFNLPQGAWIITTIIIGQDYVPFCLQYNRIMVRWRFWTVGTRKVSIICHALTRLVGKLHQK